MMNSKPSLTTHSYNFALYCAQQALPEVVSLYSLYYPQVSKQTELALKPRLKTIPPSFADSSCFVYQASLEVSELRYIVKIVHHTSDSKFWYLMQDLFGLTLAQAFGQAPKVYALLQQSLSLPVPKLIKQCEQEPWQGLVVSYLDGQAVQAEQVKPVMVEQLAVYFSQMHQTDLLPFNWVTEQNKAFVKDSQAWQKTLCTVLHRSIQDCDLADLPGSSSIPPKAKWSEWFNSLSVSQFVPCMLDCRWDQFAMQTGYLVGVFDLDAVVVAPRELDFVILEYMLTNEQLRVFIKHYQSVTPQPIPNLKFCRQAYRLLLFSLQAFGDMSLARYLDQPEFF